MDLDVTVAGRPPYRVHHKDWVPLMMLGTITGGLGLPVRVDPQDPSKILIEWNRPLTASPMAFGVTPPTGAPQPPVGSAAGVVGAALAGLGLGAAAAGAASVQAGQAITVNVTEEQEQTKQLLSTGLPGQATVSAVQDTGVSVQGQRVMVLDLVINAGGKPPQTVKHSAMVPDAAVPRVSAGASLPVRVNAANPAQFAIDWSAV
jgi:hypothetical protein